jgi:hypothetical protein
MSMQSRHGTMLGELLVIIGRLTREDVSYILQVKTEETIYELFLREAGDFQFLENILPENKLQPLALSVDMLILEGARRRDEWTRMRGALPSTRWAPKVARALDVANMGPAELSILREMNGSNTVEQIGCLLAAGVRGARVRVLRHHPGVFPGVPLDRSRTQSRASLAVPGGAGPGRRAILLGRPSVLFAASTREPRDLLGVNEAAAQSRASRGRDGLATLDDATALVRHPDSGASPSSVPTGGLSAVTHQRRLHPR